MINKPMFGLLLIGVLWAQPNEEDALNKKIESLKNEVLKIDKKISQTDSMTRVEKDRFAILVERSEKEIESKKTDIEVLENKMVDVENDIRKSVYRQNNADASVNAIEAQRDQFLKILTKNCMVLEAQISKSIPWDVEKRMSRVSSLRSDIESKNANVEEALARLKALINDEKRFGDEVAYQERPFNRNDGSLVNARILRMGNLFMIYVDDQEKNYGILRQTKDGYKMFEDLDFDQREMVREAIKVKTAKEAPKMVTLPLSLSVIAEGDK